MKTKTCPKCGSIMIGTWERHTDRLRFQCGCSYVCYEEPDDARTGMLQRLRDALAGGRDVG